MELKYENYPICAENLVMRAEYRREDLAKGVRGKHFEEFMKGNSAAAKRPPHSNHHAITIKA